MWGWNTAENNKKKEILYRNDINRQFDEGQIIMANKAMKRCLT